MCGRYSYLKSWQEIHDGLEEFVGSMMRQPPVGPEPRYNVAPTQSAPIVIGHSDGSVEGVMARWSLIPRWWQKPLEEMKASTFNAKAEGVAKAPMFRDAFKTRRCLVPVSHFYEWKKEADGSKQPMLIQPTDRELSFLGGVASHWRGVFKGEPFETETFSILTCEPNALVAPIHNRMPVFILPEDYKTWLFGAPEDAEKVAGPYPAQLMRAQPVNRALGSVKNEGAWLLAA